MVKQNGMRDGINKKEIMKSMDEDDWKRIRLQKEIEKKPVSNAEAREIMYRCDQAYQQFVEIIALIDGIVFQILTEKRTIDQNNIQISSGKVERLIKDTTIKAEISDLKISNIMGSQRIVTSLKKLWSAFWMLWNYVNQKRIDGKVIYTEEKFNERFLKVKSQLNELGIDIIGEIE